MRVVILAPICSFVLDFLYSCGKRAAVSLSDVTGNIASTVAMVFNKSDELKQER